MKCVAAFYLMGRAGRFFSNRNKFRLKEIRYVPLAPMDLGSEFEDYMSAWKEAFRLAEEMNLCTGFHHIEKIELLTLTSSENYPYVPGKSKDEKTCPWCRDTPPQPSRTQPQEVVEV